MLSPKFYPLLKQSTFVNFEKNGYDEALLLLRSSSTHEGSQIHAVSKAAHVWTAKNPNVERADGKVLVSTTIRNTHDYSVHLLVAFNMSIVLCWIHVLKCKVTSLQMSVNEGRHRRPHITQAFTTASRNPRIEIRTNFYLSAGQVTMSDLLVPTVKRNHIQGCALTSWINYKHIMNKF